MIKKLQAVALDCADPVQLAEFYAELLGGRVVTDPEDPDWVEVAGFESTTLAFQRVEGYRPPRWPGQEHPQQVHPPAGEPRTAHRHLDSASAAAAPAGAAWTSGAARLGWSRNARPSHRR